MKSELLFSDTAGPIEQMTWGCFVIAGEEHADTPLGRVGKGKDIRIAGGKVTRWKEREGHRLKKSMITGIYGNDVEVLVIGAGVRGALEVPDKVKRDAAKHGIKEVIVAPTPEACLLYNRYYREKRRVALLAHGTC